MLSDLYTIISLQTTDENSVSAEISIHPSSIIFKGHFPSKAIVPGVCQLAMIKDVLEKGIKKNTQLNSAKQIKFTDMLLPNKTTEIQINIQYEIREEEMKVSASIFTISTTFLKAKLNYKIIG